MGQPSPQLVEPSQFAALSRELAPIEAQVRDDAGFAVLNEAVWRDLDRPADGSAAFVARDDRGELRAFAHAAPSDNFAPQHWALAGFLVPGERVAALDAVLTAAVDHVARRGGGRAVLWRFGATDADDVQLQALGFARERDLYEMRVPLPLVEQPRWPADLEVRTFEPGRDEDAWLEVNNRAFGNHPEQGGWIRSTLERRMADAWFDPSLFLLAFDTEGLAGFNWLKIHEGHGRDPRLGEIFVIGIDPRAQGTGLGRALAIAGLALVAERGVSTGELFVAAENAPAVGLYTALGFTVHRTDRAYSRAVDPA